MLHTYSSQGGLCCKGLCLFKCKDLKNTMHFYTVNETKHRCSSVAKMSWVWKSLVFLCKFTSEEHLLDNHPYILAEWCWSVCKTTSVLLCQDQNLEETQNWTLADALDQSTRITHFCCCHCSLCSLLTEGGEGQVTELRQTVKDKLPLYSFAGNNTRSTPTSMNVANTQPQS